MKGHLSTVVIHVCIDDVSYLAGCAVGHAGTLITGEVEVGRTGTLVASTGRQETEVAAATIVYLTWVVGH